ncbi:hypothetical protein G9A89_009836 [Geosiphon pyriformis]|nr:hypothetical protein G9A89_009836 [Geosiphon pyriformis]
MTFVEINLDSQAVFDMCKCVMIAVGPDFHNECWIEHHHINNTVKSKVLSVRWNKVKGHSGIIGNEHADFIAEDATGSGFYLVADDRPVSGNACHFVRKLFNSVCCSEWKSRCTEKFVDKSLARDFDWPRIVLVWHPEEHMSLYKRLPVALRKRLYNASYPSAVCLHCGLLEDSDHAFLCESDSAARNTIIDDAVAKWCGLSSLSPTESLVIRLLHEIRANGRLYMAVAKGFVLRDWVLEATKVFTAKSEAVVSVVNFVCNIVIHHRLNISLRKFYEFNDLIFTDGSVVINVSGLLLCGSVVNIYKPKFIHGIMINFGLDATLSLMSLGFYGSVCASCNISLLCHLDRLEWLYDKSKLFIFDYEATVGCSIAVMKKAAKVSGSNDGFKPVLPRKRRRGGALEDGSSETGNTTEFDSVNMEEKCLVEETSFRQESGEESGGVNTDMMPKGPKKIVTKCILGKPLGTINFSMENDDDDDILDGLLTLPPPFSLRHMVQVSKLAYVRKIFSGVNGFGGASTPSKFGGIIRASFISEKAMMAVAKMTNDHGVMVNTNLKHSRDNCTNRVIVLKKIPVRTSVEAVHAVVSKFGKIKIIKIQLSIFIGKDAVCVARADINKQSWDARDSFRTLLHTLLMETTAHDLWDFIGSISEKICFIDCNLSNYSHVHCISVCFNSKLDLVNAIAVTLVIKGVGLRWSHFSLVSCVVCKNFGHTSLSCRFVKNAAFLNGRKAVFSAQDQLRLVRIYAKKSAPISCPLAFGGKTWVSVVDASSALFLSSSKSQFGSIINGEPLPSVVGKLEECLVSIESSLVSLAEQISELAKRLDSLMPAVSQPSPGCQLLVTPPIAESEG